LGFRAVCFEFVAEPEVGYERELAEIKYADSQPKDWTANGTSATVGRMLIGF
jgi:hypothetical protein